LRSTFTIASARILTIRDVCVRCQAAEAPEPLGLCTPCALNARLEIVAGMKRLCAYLAAWAAFDDWLRGRSQAI
jgi:hypothetical protein